MSFAQIGRKCWFGAAESIDGIVRRIKESWPVAGTPLVVATGGLAPVLAWLTVGALLALAAAFIAAGPLAALLNAAVLLAGLFVVFLVLLLPDVLAIFDERIDEFVREVRMGAAMAGALGEAEVRFLGEIIHALGREVPDLLRQELRVIRRRHELGNFSFGQFGAVHHQRFVLDQRPFNGDL